jgi:PAS domain S-box-containing protein
VERATPSNPSGGEEQLRAIAAHVRDAAWITSADGREVLFVNPAGEALWGHSAEELLARPGLWMPSLEAGDRAAVSEAFPPSAGAEPPTLRYRVDRPDGSPRWVEHRLIPLRGANGRVQRVLSIAEDVTALRSAHEALVESEERFRLAARATNDVVWERDLRTGEIAWNEAAGVALGHPQRGVDFTADWWTRNLHPEDRERVLSSLRAAVEGAGQFWTEEYQFRRADGSYATVLDRGFVARAEDGRPVRMVGAMANVTDYKRLEEQLHLSQRMEAVGRLAGGIAHDFNNILMVIEGSTDLLLDGLAESDPVCADLKEIRKAAERATSLTRQLLAFGRRQVLRPKVVDLNASVAEIQRMLERILGEDLTLVTDLAPELGRVEVDPGQFEQVLLNLAVNARDAMPKGGVLTVETRDVVLTEKDTRRFAYRVDPGPYVRVRVSDTGNGIAEETLAHIFEPFFTTKEQGKGTGLGLSTVYGIVKQSGGYIWAESTEGEGSTFDVYLPSLGSVPLPVPASNKRGARAPLRQRIGTILLVEDEDVVRSIARRILVRSGYAVLEAASGPAALRLCEERGGEIDLLITDVVMPQMSGRELADHVTERFPGVRVLYMSGHIDDLVVRHGVQHASNGFIQKPFPPEVLLRRVGEALLKKRQRLAANG